MYARVTTFAGSAVDADAGIESFRANVVPWARENGAKTMLLLDRASGEGLAITIWDDEETMRTSEDRAQALRADAVDQIGATAEPMVARYEVAVYEV